MSTGAPDKPENCELILLNEKRKYNIFISFSVDNFYHRHLCLWQWSQMSFSGLWVASTKSYFSSSNWSCSKSCLNTVLPATSRLVALLPVTLLQVMAGYCLTQRPCYCWLPYCWISWNIRNRYITVQYTVRNGSEILYAIISREHSWCPLTPQHPVLSRWQIAVSNIKRPYAQQSDCYTMGINLYQHTSAHRHMQTIFNTIFSGKPPKSSSHTRQLINFWTSELTHIFTHTHYSH